MNADMQVDILWQTDSCSKRHQIGSRLILFKQTRHLSLRLFLQQVNHTFDVIQDNRLSFYATFNAVNVMVTNKTKINIFVYDNIDCTAPSRHFKRSAWHRTQPARFYTDETPLCAFNVQYNPCKLVPYNRKINQFRGKNGEYKSVPYNQMFLKSGFLVRT